MKQTGLNNRVNWKKNAAMWAGCVCKLDSQDFGRNGDAYYISELNLLRLNQHLHMSVEEMSV